MIDNEKSVVVCVHGNWIPKQVKYHQIGQHLKVKENRTINMWTEIQFLSKIYMNFFSINFYLPTILTFNTFLELTTIRHEYVINLNLRTILRSFSRSLIMTECKIHSQGLLIAQIHLFWLYSWYICNHGYIFTLQWNKQKPNSLWDRRFPWHCWWYYSPHTVPPVWTFSVAPAGSWVCFPPGTGKSAVPGNGYLCSPG